MVVTIESVALAESKAPLLGRAKPRVAVINHHGRTPGGAEQGLGILLESVKEDLDLAFIFFESGEFFDLIRASFGHTTLVPMSSSVAGATRSRATITAMLQTVNLIYRVTVALNRMDVDVVVTNSMKAHIVGSIAAFFAKKPVINYFHDLPNGRALKLTQCVSKIFAKSRLSCSRKVAEHFALPKTQVVYPPLQSLKSNKRASKSEARVALGIPDDGGLVFSLVGRLARWKGQDTFLRIAARVLREENAHFIIAGGPVFGVDDAYLPDLIQLSKKLGIEEKVHFIPWSRDLQNVYSATDVCCNCSIMEPFGRTIIEALDYGVPGVCFDDGGTTEALVDGVTGVVVSSGNEERYASVLLEFVKRPDMLRTMSIAATLDSGRFAASVGAAILKQTVESIASEKSAN